MWRQGPRRKRGPVRNFDPLPETSPPLPRVTTLQVLAALTAYRTGFRVRIQSSDGSRSKPRTSCPPPRCPPHAPPTCSPAPPPPRQPTTPPPPAAQHQMRRHPLRPPHKCRLVPHHPHARYRRHPQAHHPRKTKYHPRANLNAPTWRHVPPPAVPRPTRLPRAPGRT